MESGSSYSMALVMVVPKKELGLEASPKSVPQFTPVFCGDHLSPSQKAQVAKSQHKFSNVLSPNLFLPLPSHMDLIEHHIETPPGMVVHNHLLYTGYLNIQK